MRAVLPMSAVLTLSACALHQPPNSYVVGLPETDAGVISTRIAEITAARLPRGEKVSLARLANETHAAQEVAARLDEALLARGLSLVNATSDGHVLRYEVMPYGPSWLLRVYLDDAETTTVMTRSRGGAWVATALTREEVK